MPKSEGTLDFCWSHKAVGDSGSTGRSATHEDDDACGCGDDEHDAMDGVGAEDDDGVIEGADEVDEAGRGTLDAASVFPRLGNVKYSLILLCELCLF